MSVLLKKNEHEVDTASSKDEVYMHLNNAKPSLILMDVLLSGADGREICREIKADENLKDIPVIMFSAHPSAKEKIASYGADDFLSKPLNTESLLEKVNGYLT